MRITMCLLEVLRTKLRPFVFLRVLTQITYLRCVFSWIRCIRD